MDGHKTFIGISVGLIAIAMIITLSFFGVTRGASVYTTIEGLLNRVVDASSDDASIRVEFGNTVMMSNSIAGINTLSFNTSYVPTGAELVGTRYWDAAQNTTSLVLEGGGLLQDGQEVYMIATNLSGVDVTDGQAVSVYTATGNRIAFTLTSASDRYLAAACIGLATEDIANNETGRITVLGQVHELNTNAFTEGQYVYVDPASPGNLTATLPEAPSYKIAVGVVEVKSATVGVIMVRPLFIPKLSGLSDVFSTAPTTTGQLLSWDQSNTRWAVQDSWEDLNFDPDRSGGPAVSKPDSVTINNVFHSEFTSANNQLCGAVQEIPHEYKLSSTLYPHIHIFLKGGESAGTTGVTFTFYWELRQSTGTTIGSVALSATSAQLTSSGAHKFDIYDATGFAGSATLGGQLSCAIARTAGNAGDIIVTTYGVHYMTDTPGSHLIGTK